MPSDWHLNPNKDLQVPVVAKFDGIMKFDWETPRAFVLNQLKFLVNCPNDQAWQFGIRVNSNRFQSENWILDSSFFF